MPLFSLDSKQLRVRYPYFILDQAERTIYRLACNVRESLLKGQAMALLSSAWSSICRRNLLRHVRGTVYCPQNRVCRDQKD